MKKNRLVLFILISITGFIGMVFLLYINKFFENYKSQTFNEVITPVVTIFAAIIYLYTLFEIIRQSKINNNNFQFSLLKEKIEKEKIKLMNWKLGLKPINELEVFSELISESNGLKYFKLYNAIYSKIRNSNDYLSDLENGVILDINDKREYVQLIYDLFSINFELSLNNSSIENLLKEINQSDMSDFQKGSLNELIFLELLNDYLMIFYDYQKKVKQKKLINGKFVEFSYNEIIYKSEMLVPHSIVDSELKLKSSLKDVEFDRLSNYIFENKLWK